MDRIRFQRLESASPKIASAAARANNEYADNVGMSSRTRSVATAADTLDPAFPDVTAPAGRVFEKFPVVGEKTETVTVQLAFAGMVPADRATELLVAVTVPPQVVETF